MLAEVGWDGKGMCGQWSQKQGNAYKNTEERSGSGWEEERGEEMRAAERLAGVVCLSTINGRAGKAGKALGWMLAEAELGRRQQIFEHPACTSGRGFSFACSGCAH